MSCSTEDRGRKRLKNFPRLTAEEQRDPFRPLSLSLSRQTSPPLLVHLNDSLVMTLVDAPADAAGVLATIPSLEEAAGCMDMGRAQNTEAL